LESKISFTVLTRRGALQSAAALVLATTRASWALPARASAQPITVAQIFDASNARQDVAKDFLIGSRAA
jgi:hypothetical protein